MEKRLPLVHAAAKLHAAVDHMTAPIEAAHRDRLVCKEGCTSCCVDDLTVSLAEAQLLVQHARDVLRAEPHPEGACAFLSPDGACRVYAHRPYVCRTQGLPLRWLDETEEGEVVERRDICPLNEPGEPRLEEIEPAACWTLGPVERKLAEIHASLPDDERDARIALRSLFDEELPPSLL